MNPRGHLYLRMKTLLLIPVLLLSIWACKRSDEDQNPIPQVKKYPAYILAGQQAGNGIYYRQLIPVITLQLHQGCGATDSCILDVNGDGTDDFIVSLSGYFSSGGLISRNTIRPLGTNEIAVRPEGTLLADTIRAGDTIGKNLSMENKACVLYYDISSGQADSSFGYWRGAGIKYLGVKVHALDTIFFGWIRITIPNAHFLYVYEYAGTTGY
jgi:hypothetical protein